MVTKSDRTILRSTIDIIGFLIICLIFILQSILKWLLPKRYNRYKNIKGEIVLITGGGGGLGRLIATRLAQFDTTIVLWDINKDAVDETVKLIEDVGGRAYGYKCDLANKDDVYQTADKTRQEVGDVTILINNAGVLSGQLLLDTPDALITRTFEVNVLAHFWTVKAFLPKMIEHNHGHIVTIASMAGYVGVNKLVDYCSSKFAAVGFDEALRIELEQQGITGVSTTLICPYFIQATGMFEKVNARFLPTLKAEDVADRIVEALRKNEVEVMIPSVFRLLIAVRFLVPWECVSMFLRNLVPDAAPHQQSSTTLTAQTSVETLASMNRENALKGSIASLTNSDKHCGKNL